MLDRGDPLVTALGLTNLFGCVCCREIGGKEVRRAGQAQVQFGEGAYAGLSPPDLEVQGVTALAAVLVEEVQVVAANRDALVVFGRRNPARCP